MKVLKVFGLSLIIFFLQVKIVSAQDNPSAKAEIQQLNNKMAEAVKNQNIFAIMDFYTDDAVALPSNQPMIKGKEAIKRRNEKDMKDGSQMTNMKLTTDQVFGTGDIVYEIGTYNATFKMLNGFSQTMDDNGKYITIWQRVNGQWKIKAEMWNSDRSPAEIVKSIEDQR